LINCFISENFYQLISLKSFFQVRVSAVSTWAASSTTSSANVTVNGEPIVTAGSGDDSAVTPFYVQRVSAAHSYRSLTPLNMDVSEVQANNSHTPAAVAKKLFSHDESTDDDDDEKARTATSNETSLEMIKISLTSSSAPPEDRVAQTEITLTEGADENDATPNSLSDRTLGPELPSLPTDGCEDSEPVSLSHIQLQDMSASTET